MDHTIRNQLLAATSPRADDTLHIIDLAWSMVGEIARQAGARVPPRLLDAAIPPESDDGRRFDETCWRDLEENPE